MKNIIQKTLLLLLLVTSSIACQSQKKYRIIKTTWSFEKPASYIFREDHFADATGKGAEAIRKNDPDARLLEGEVVLLSAAKSDSSDMNIIRVGHEPNKNIANLTLKGYVDEFVAYMKESYQNNGASAASTVRQAKIDGIDFYVIESTISHPGTSLTYGTLMYVAEIDSREFSITATYDNAADKKLIEQSITASKFN